MAAGESALGVEAPRHQAEGLSDARATPSVAGVLEWMRAEFQPASATLTRTPDAHVFRVEQGSPSPTLLITHAVFHEHTLGEILTTLERAHVAARLRSDPITPLRCIARDGHIAIAGRPSWHRSPQSAALELRTSDAQAADPLRVAAELVAALPHPVVVAALDRRVLAANLAAARLFGCGLDQLLCTSLDELVVPRERRRVAAQDRRALRGEAQRYDTTVSGADGRERQVGVVTTRLVLDGYLVGTVAAFSPCAALIPLGGDACTQSCAATA